MQDWKRMIPGIAGASLALGGEGCNSGAGGPSVNSVKEHACLLDQACSSYWYYDTVAECVQGHLDIWNNYERPGLQALGGGACIDAYLSFYECMLDQYDAQTCVDPNYGDILTTCASSLDALFASCSLPGNQDAALLQLAMDGCTDYQACDPVAFGDSYASQAQCINAMRLDFMLDLAGADAACATASIAAERCEVDAVTAPTCDYSAAYQSCASERTAASTACAGRLAVPGAVNKDRSGGERHRPRWLRRRD